MLQLVLHLNKVRLDEHWFRYGTPRRPLMPPHFRFNWNSPLTMSPSNPRVLYFGGNVEHSLRAARAYLERVVGRSRDYGLASFAYRGFDTSTGEMKPE